jgi:hypothetical protein
MLSDTVLGIISTKVGDLAYAGLKKMVGTP